MTEFDDGLEETLNDGHMDNEPRTNIFIAMLSVVSVTIGAGMVAIPNSAYNSGIPWAVAFNTFNFVL